MRADARRPIEPWPWALAGLLVAMIGSSLLLWSIAASNPDGLVAEDAWQAGLQYNAQVAAARAASDLGVTFAIETVGLADGVRVAVRLEDATEAGHVGGVWVDRIRPAETGFDQRFDLAADGAGWAGDVPLPLQGRWKLVVTADLDAGPLRHEILHWRAPGAD